MTTTVMSAACTGEPVSWLRLEQHALAPDAAVAGHLAECAACRACFGGIEAERGRALPPPGDLAVAAAARRRRRRRAGFLGSAAALAAAAVVLLVVLSRGDDELPGIKGGDELTLGLVRERGGEVAMDPTGFRAGDRFKALVTCASRGAVEVAVTVEQAGETFNPLAVARIRCGNRIVLPGAFSLTGDRPATVCARIGARVACLPLAREP